MLGRHERLVNRKFRCIKRLSEDSARLGGILMQLRDQCFNAAELLSITQTGDEIDSDRGAI